MTPRRMAWKRVTRPKSIDLLLDGLDDDRPTARLARRDRLRLSSDTTDRETYERLVSMLKDLHSRATMMDVLRALRDHRTTLSAVRRAYVAGADALAALAGELGARDLYVLLDDYVAELRRQHVKEADDRKRKIERFLAVLGGRGSATTAQFTTEQVGKFLAQLTTAGKHHAGKTPTPSTLNNYRAALSGFATYLVGLERLDKHPIAFKKVRRTKRPDDRPPRPLTGDEYGRFFAAAIDRDADAADVLRLLIHSGADLGEIIGNRKRNIAPIPVANVRARRDDVVQLALQRSKTGTAERTVPLPKRLTPMVRGWLAKGEDAGADWTPWAAISKDRVWRALEAGRAAIGRSEIKVKTLRHLAAIQWVLAGVPVPQIRRWLGHATLAQTQVYVDFVDEWRKEHREVEVAAALWDVSAGREGGGTDAATDAAVEAADASWQEPADVPRLADRRRA